MSKVSSNQYYHFRCLWPGMHTLPKITSFQNSKFAMSLQYFKKKLEMKLIFCIQVNIKVSVDFNTLGIKISYKVILSLLIGSSSILKVLKVTSLQYLYNISEKKLGMQFIFCMQINKVSTSWHYHFDGSGQTCLKYQK